MSAGFLGRLVRNPWVVISAVGHAIVLAVISVVVMMKEPEADHAVPTTVSIVGVPKDEPEVALPIVVDRERVPQLQDADVQPNDLPEWSQPQDESQPTAELSDLPAADPYGGSPYGVGSPGHRGLTPTATRGSPPGGKFAPRFGPKGRGPGGRPTADAVRKALQWLADHQDPDGRWDAANFMKHDVDGTPCDGAGRRTNDIGVTALALLAFLGDGHTLRGGVHKRTVRRAVAWLQDQQDEETGRFGTESSHGFIYSHAIATLAICEAFGLSEHAPLRRCANKALGYIHRARNPYKVWRYFPADGANDTSVTGWMVLALVSAREFGLAVDEAALEASAVWLDEVTDPATGRAGYTRRGEGSSRPASLVDKFPSAKSEAMTAVALLCRSFLGQDPKTTPVMTAAADTLLKLPPVWDTSSGSIDMYYWYYASYALFQMGGRWWEAWNTKMTDAFVRSQRDDGNAQGSWDPVDPWGEEGGRVYATAVMCLSLEVYYRYSRVLGGR